jgi:hypothetical protein
MPIWRRVYLTTLVAVMLAASAGSVTAAEFFRSIDDLPLAPGLTEAVEQGVQFDSPAGRIVTAVAQSSAGKTPPISTVRAFYRRVLPPLGWIAGAADTYKREGERLTLRFENAGGRIIVRIRLVPAAASPGPK